MHAGWMIQERARRLGDMSVCSAHNGDDKVVRDRESLFDLASVHVCDGK